MYVPYVRTLCTYVYKHLLYNVSIHLYNYKSVLARVHNIVHVNAVHTTQLNTKS